MEKFIYIRPSKNFFQEAQEYISINFDIDNIFIITKDTYSAMYMQNSFLNSNNNVSIIPEIIPITNIKLYFSYLINNEIQYDKIFHIFEIAKIIFSYYENIYSRNESFKIAEDILDIYNLLKINDIDFAEIESWTEQDIAEHWWKIASFLKYCFDNYENFLKKNNISSTISFILPEILQKKLNKQFIFVAIDEFMTSKQNIENLFNQKNSYFILPQFSLEAANNEIFYNQENSINKQMNFSKDYINKNKLDNFYKIESIDRMPLIIQLYENIKNNIYLYESRRMKELYKNEIIYLEFNNLNIEIDYICKKYIESKPKNKSICIILTDKNFANALEQKIENIGLEYNSTFAEPIFLNNICDFVLKLASFKKSDGEFLDFIKILRCNILSSDAYIIELIENLSSNDSKTHGNFLSFIEESKNYNENFKNYILLPLQEFLKLNSNNFLDNFLYIIKIFEEMLKYSLKKSQNLIMNSDEIANFFKNILSLNSIEIRDYNEFYEILDYLFETKIRKKFNRNAKINIIRPSELLSFNYDMVIIPDFNFKDKVSDNLESWFGSRIKKKLDLKTTYSEFKYLEYLISILQNQMINSNLELVFSRSKFVKNIITTESPIISDIRNIKKFETDINFITQDNAKKNLDVDDYISVNPSLMPDNLYPSNIELLVRNPYGFFARKILSLYKYREIFDKRNASDFGNLIHQVIHDKTLDLSRNILSIYEEKMNVVKINQDEKILWNISVKKLLEKLDEYILSSHKNLDYVFSEETLETDIFLPNSNRYIKLKAIIDRIEVDAKNKIITIIDFKTGTVPSKKDIESGISPQLIISYIILYRSGIKNLKINFKDYKINLQYIKLSSKDPYIEFIDMDFLFEEILEHEKSMIEFLDYYYSECKFIIKKLPDHIRPEYDDYQHFARYSNIID